METMAEDTSEAQQVTLAEVQVPFEGEFPSLGGATAWLNSPPLCGDRPARESRPHRLLDLHLRQLAAHATLCARLGR